MRRLCTLTLVFGWVCLAALGAPTAAAEDKPANEVVVDHLNNPTGVLVDPDGTIWVAESGVPGSTKATARNFDIGKDGDTALIGDSASVLRVDPNGKRTKVAQLPAVKIGMMMYGAHHIVKVGDVLYVPTTAWTADVQAKRVPYAGTVVRIEKNKLSMVADLYEYERVNNPNGFRIESDPFGIAVGPDGNLLVTEAGANTLVKINPTTGEMLPLAVFGSLASPIPNPNRNDQMATDPVPTGIDIDKDGNAFVGFFSGFPFIPGAAAVVKVSPSGAITPYATNLTMLTDVAFGPDGNLYAVAYGAFTGQGFDGTKGMIVRVKAGKASEIVATGVDSPSALAFTAAGDAYVATKSASGAGKGQIVRYNGLIYRPSLGRVWDESNALTDKAWTAPGDQVVAADLAGENPLFDMPLLGGAGGLALVAAVVGLGLWRRRRMARAR